MWVLLVIALLPSGEEYRMEKQFSNQGECQWIAGLVREDLRVAIRPPKKWSVTCQKR